MADETLNGNDTQPQFLGIDTGISRLAMVQQLMDVDGRSMIDVRDALDRTANFASAMDTLLMKIGHMRRVLTLVGQHKVKEHSCWFCTRAVGSDDTRELGLLKELTV